MAKPDLIRAAERFLHAIHRVEAGLILQRQRIIDRTANASRIDLAGLDMEITNFMNDPGIDLDYYVYDLGRLRHTAEAVIKVWYRATGMKPQPVVAALMAFDRELPKLKDIRDPITHPTNDDKLGKVAWFSSVVLLHPGGGVETLVDPDSYNHDVAIALATSIADLCRQVIRDAIAANPPKPLNEQIQERNQQYMPKGK